jgi:exosortase
MNVPRYSRHILFAVLMAGLACAFWNPLSLLLEFSFQHEHYSHIVLIPFVSAFLVFKDRQKIFVSPTYHAGWGLGLWVAGFAALAVRFRMGSALSENDFLSVTILSFFIFWLGMFLFCYGPRAFRAGAFPLLFLILVVPIPDLPLNSAIRFLQYQSAEASAALFKLTGVPIFRDGLTFYLPGVTIYVAEECSGIRSSLALFITGLLAGHLFLRSTWSKVLMLLVVVPIAVLKNGIRIVSLTTLAVVMDPGFLSGRLHRQGGVVFFGIALCVLGLVLWILQWCEGRQRKSAGRRESRVDLTPEADAEHSPRSSTIRRAASE